MDSMSPDLAQLKSKSGGYGMAGDFGQLPITQPRLPKNLFLESILSPGRTSSMLLVEQAIPRFRFFFFVTGCGSCHEPCGDGSKLDLC